MNMATELTSKPRKKAGEGPDPLLLTRASPALIAQVRARAAARKVSVSALIREALARHLESEAA
jgi:hypothetical protein